MLKLVYKDYEVTRKQLKKCLHLHLHCFTASAAKLWKKNAMRRFEDNT